MSQRYLSRKGRMPQSILARRFQADGSAYLKERLGLGLGLGLGWFGLSEKYKL